MESLIASTSGPRIRVEIAIESSLPPATAEVNQLEMALLNLAVNARDAMPEGGTLTIKADAQRIEPGTPTDLAPGDYVRLSVSDTGIGMDAHTQAHAIEPFFSTKGIGKGTGLGLSMVHGLTSQLGGALKIASKVGLGTAIEVLLPVAQGATTEIAPIAQKQVDIRRRGTVLLVDDEQAVRATTADMLEELGYAVVEAGSAEEAIGLFDQCPIELIVTDYMMGGMTGMELITQLRAGKPELPILVISGYADAEGIAADIPRLTKPFRSADLADMLALVAPLK